MALILIADDSSIVCDVYKDMLDLMGHTSIICYDGKQAVEAFKNRNPDLVLLDVNMPVLNGIEACKEIRRIPSGITVPIVMISSLDDEEDVLRGLNAGADDYLPKPVKSTFLTAKLKNLLGTAALHKDDFELAKTKTTLAGRYNIKKVLGYGSHSVVFLATDSEKDDSELAIKLLKRDFACMDIAEPFVEVAGKYMKAKCKSLVQIYDVGMYDGRAYLAMEYVPGGSVLSRLRARTMADWEACKLGLDIVKALIAVKEQGALHLDIKPENIMINGPDYKLADFGIMIARDSATVPIGMDLWSTPEFICPEYLSGEHDISARSDVYSLGVTLYQAVSGENPFSASSPASSMFRQINLTPPPLNEVDDSISQGFSDAVDAMLDKDPDERPRLVELEDIFSKLYAYLKYASVHKAEFVKENAGVDIPEIPSEQEWSEAEVTERNKAGKALDAMLKTSKITARRLGKELQTYKIPRSGVAIILVVLLACIIIGMIVDRAINARVIPVAEAQGPLNVVQCANKHRFEVRFKRIEDVCCKECGESVGIAYNCLKCHKKFALPKPKKDMTESELEVFEETRYNCPFCKSSKTAAALTSTEKK
jgi:DNA-binding response OmpR family regulator